MAIQKNIKIILSPFNSNIEIVDIMAIQVHVPYSENEVTVLINPNITEYQEKQDKPGIKIRQFTVTESTEQTKKLKFDFKDNNIHKVKINEKTFEIKLMTIDKEKIQGREFPYFEFFINEI